MNVKIEQRFRAAVAAQSRGDTAVARQAYLALLNEHDCPRADILCNLSSIALAGGDYLEAELKARQALALAPDDANVYNNLGYALAGQQKPDQAITAYADCIRRDPNHVVAWQNLIRALHSNERESDAIAALTQARQINASDVDLLQLAIYLKLETASWAGLDRDLLQCQQLLARGAAINPYVLFTCCLDPRELLQAARNSAVAEQRKIESIEPWQPLAVNDRLPIRIGYLSCTLRSHATGYLVKNMIAAHDRERFRVIAYVYGEQNDDPFTRSLHGLFDEVVDLNSMDDRMAVSRIREDCLDILFDIDAFANAARPSIAAARVAPIQVSWLGYMATTGAAAIDYIIADDIVIPPADEQYFSECIARLPGGLFPLDNDREVSNRFTDRASLGLPADAVVLCAFNQTRKITPPTLDAWVRILQQTDNTVLWLWANDALGKTNLTAELAARGIDNNRVFFADSLISSDHLCRYRFVDIFLDCFPCNAHTMASDALYMNVPMVSLQGNTMPSRIAGSLLQRLRLDEWVATDIDSYVSLASRLAGSTELRQQLSTTIRQNKTSTGLFNIRRYVREFETAIHHMVQRSRNGLPPASF